VKLAEFNALCDREWEKQDRGGRGDVVSLTLTETSAEELRRGMLMAGFQGIHILPGPDEAINPITRTVVKIRTRKDGARETARVRVPAGYRQTWWPTGT
jgi:hypothetical protein